MKGSSRLFKITKNPLTMRFEMAEWLRDHFALGIDGVKFPDGSIYNPAVVMLKIHNGREE